MLKIKNKFPEKTLLKITHRIKHAIRQVDVWFSSRVWFLVSSFLKSFYRDWWVWLGSLSAFFALEGGGCDGNFDNDVSPFGRFLLPKKRKNDGEFEMSATLACALVISLLECLVLCAMHPARVHLL